MRFFALFFLLALAMRAHSGGTWFWNYGLLYCGTGVRWCYKVELWELDYKKRKKRHDHLATTGSDMICTTETHAYYYLIGSDNWDRGTNDWYELGTEMWHTCGGGQTKYDPGSTTHTYIPFNSPGHVIFQVYQLG